MNNYTNAYIRSITLDPRTGYRAKYVLEEVYHDQSNSMAMLDYDVQRLLDTIDKYKLKISVSTKVSSMISTP